MRRTRIVGLIGVTLVVFIGRVGWTQQSAPQPGADWPMYRRDYAGTGYSPLSQINTKNVASLRDAWSYSLQGGAPVSGPPGRGGGPNSQATPIVVNGSMYLPTANRVVALDSETGTERWSHTVSDAPPSRRGVAVLGR